MKESIKYKKQQASRRMRRVRAKIRGTAARPRMSVHLTGRHLFVQFINDEAGKTLFSAADTLLASPQKKGAHLSAAALTELGKKVAEAAVAQGIGQVVLDRGAKAYHGRIKALADGAREGGLKF